MDSANRPVSPHIQVYKPQLTSVLSILHRMTGVALAIGAVLFAVWLTLIAYDAEFLIVSLELLSGVWGRLFLFLWTFTLFYHFCNGIRHLVWDAGHGLEIVQVYRSGWSVIIGTFALTIIVWTIGYTACA